MEAKRANKIRLRPDTQNPADAARVLTTSGDATFVVRGVVRALVLRCPCGCGDNYIINLDPRGGPAWRYYRRKGSVSLYPSYWRDGGCGSHFIINRNEIWWCDFGEDWITDYPAELIAKVLTAVEYNGVVVPRELAEQLDEIPWDIWAACEKLVRDRRLDRIGRGLDTSYRQRVD